MLQVNLIPGAIYEIMASVCDTCCITKADRYALMAAILDESLTKDERRCVDRLLRSLIKGRIQVVDELSSIRSI